MSLSLSKFLEGNRLRGFGIKVVDANCGVLFSALIEGTGVLITDLDEDGNYIPFLTTDEILKQLMKFGFYITYNERRHLPEETFDYLAKLQDLGYDKITRVALESIDKIGNRIWRPIIIVMKSEFNTDLLIYDCKVTRKSFNQKLTDNVIMNITFECNAHWDWVTYTANISDILDENLSPMPMVGSSDEAISGPEYGPDSVLTEYGDEDGPYSEIVNDGESGDGDGTN